MLCWVRSGIEYLSVDSLKETYKGVENDKLINQYQIRLHDMSWHSFNIYPQEADLFVYKLSYFKLQTITFLVLLCWGIG